MVCVLCVCAGHAPGSGAAGRQKPPQHGELGATPQRSVVGALKFARRLEQGGADPDLRAERECEGLFVGGWGASVRGRRGARGKKHKNKTHLHEQGHGRDPVGRRAAAPDLLQPPRVARRPPPKRLLVSGRLGLEQGVGALPQALDGVVVEGERRFRGGGCCCPSRSLLLLDTPTLEASQLLAALGVERRVVRVGPVRGSRRGRGRRKGERGARRRECWQLRLVPNGRVVLGQGRARGRGRAGRSVTAAAEQRGRARAGARVPAALTDGVARPLTLLLRRWRGVVLLLAAVLLAVLVVLVVAILFFAVALPRAFGVLLLLASVLLASGVRRRRKVVEREAAAAVACAAAAAAQAERRRKRADLLRERRVLLSLRACRRGRALVARHRAPGWWREVGGRWGLLGAGASLLWCRCAASPTWVRARCLCDCVFERANRCSRVV